MSTMEHSDRHVEFLAEVRKRMRQTFEDSGLGELECQEADALERIRTASREVRKRLNVVGTLPPQPDSLRARMGMGLVRMVRQALFWYTPQIAAYQSAATEALEMHVTLFEMVCRRLERTEARLAALQLEVDRLAGRE